MSFSRELRIIFTRTLLLPGLYTVKEEGGFKQKLYQAVYKTENDIRVDACYDIIQDDSKSSLKPFLQTTDRKGLQNVEKPEEKKTDDHEEKRFWNPEHGD